MRYLVAVMLVLLAVQVQAAPFLVCDPQEGATEYLIENLLSTPIETPAEPDGSLKLDMGGLPDGQYDIQVRAKNFWGQSDASPFEFVKQLPGKPENVRLEK